MASATAMHSQCNSLQELSGPPASVKAGSQPRFLPKWLFPLYIYSNNILTKFSIAYICIRIAL